MLYFFWRSRIIWISKYSIAITVLIVCSILQSFFKANSQIEGTSWLIQVGGTTQNEPIFRTRQLPSGCFSIQVLSSSEQFIRGGNLIVAEVRVLPRSYVIITIQRAAWHLLEHSSRTWIVSWSHHRVYGPISVDNFALINNSVRKIHHWIDFFSSQESSNTPGMALSSLPLWGICFSLGCAVNRKYSRTT